MSKQALFAAAIIAACAGSVARVMPAELGPPLASRTPIFTHAPDWRLFEWPLRVDAAVEIEGAWRPWEDHGELARIVTWLSQHTAFPPIYNPPKIYIAAPVKLTSSRLDPESGADGSLVVPIIGRYDDTTRTIYLPLGWKTDLLADKSALVHQVIYHLQNLSGQKHECPQARARVAFDAQALWLRQFGRSLDIEFGFGAEELLFKTECYIP